jgi:hypothetical protein
VSAINQQKLVMEEKIARFLEATDAKNLTELANILKITPQSISGAIKRGNIPGDWIQEVALRFSVSADWLLFGAGPKQRVHAEISDNTSKNNIKKVGKPSDSKERQKRLLKASLSDFANFVLKKYSLALNDYDDDGHPVFFALGEDEIYSEFIQEGHINIFPPMLPIMNPMDFWPLWDAYVNQDIPTRGWVQIEIIKRFPEFVKWLKFKKNQIKEPDKECDKE